MTRYVIAAATLLRIVAEDAPVAPEHQIVAPSSIRSEALSLLFGAVRRGELTEEAALQRHDRTTELEMRLLGDRVARRTAWRIAREQGWRRRAMRSTSQSHSCRPMRSSPLTQPSLGRRRAWCRWCSSTPSACRRPEAEPDKMLMG
ncbi:MAG: PIN domain-containing protein [Actinomycetes bacterium]